MITVRRILGSILLAAVAAVSAEPQPPTPDEQTLISAHLATDGPALLAYFKMRTVGDADRQRIIGLIRELGDASYAVRERASNDLIAAGLPAVGLLRQGQSDSDIEVARRCQKCLDQIERVPSSSLSVAAVRLIALRRPPGTVAALLAYLPLADDESVADQIREALAKISLEELQTDPLLETALDDPLPMRRSAAAEALIRSGKPSALAASRKALKDANRDVRLSARIAFVVYAKEKDSIPAMIALLGELPQNSAWRVEGVLNRLAGENAPQVSLGSDEASRHKCRDAWLGWWEKHGAKLDLAKLDGAPPVLGYTLLVLRDPRGPGRIVEINAQREVVWKLEGLQMPVDAVVCAKDRVLIAEQGNQPDTQRISERDFQGNVIWTKPHPMAIGVQRLPNRNTLAVGRNQIAEWDIDRNVVWSHERPQRYDITTARKLTNGEVVFLTNQGECVRLDANRKEIKTFSLGVSQQYSFGGIEELPNDSLLVTTRTTVAEFDREGRVKWSAPAMRPISAQRLANGNTLVANSGGQNVIEVDRKGLTVWEYRPAGATFIYKARRR